MLSLINISRKIMNVLLCIASRGREAYKMSGMTSKAVLSLIG
jgi:hypothetical protein